MITEQEYQQLSHAVRTAGVGNIDRIVQCANEGVMTVPNLLFLIEVRPEFPLQIYDMDGTLGDTEPTAFLGNARVMNRFGKRNHREFNFTGAQLLKAYVGRSFTSVATELQKTYGFTVSAKELEYYARLEKRTVMQQFRVCGIAPVAGSKNLIVASAAVGFKLAIASSSAHERIMLCVRLLGLSEYFTPDRCFSGNDMKASKPKPDVYTKTAESMGELPGRCISFEDAENGVISARDAGIGIRLGITDLTPEPLRAAMEETLRKAGAHAVTASFERMPELMWRLASSKSSKS